MMDGKMNVIYFKCYAMLWNVHHIALCCDINTESNFTLTQHSIRHSQVDTLVVYTIIIKLC